MNHLSLPEELLRLLKVLWRVIAAMLLAEIAGMIIAFVIEPYKILFLNLWYGAVYAAPVGYLLGLIWLKIAEPRRISKERIPLAILGFMLIFTTLGGYLFSILFAEFRSL